MRAPRSQCTHPLPAESDSSKRLCKLAGWSFPDVDITTIVQLSKCLFPVTHGSIPVCDQKYKTKKHNEISCIVFGVPEDLTAAAACP